LPLLVPLLLNILLLAVGVAAAVLLAVEGEQVGSALQQGFLLLRVLPIRLLSVLAGTGHQELRLLLLEV
jgi:hypothetical protein